MKTVNIYTDGACSGNQNENNIGGWGCILEYGSAVKELHGGLINTTNNVMELSALIAALDALKEKGLLVRIFSDSSYLISCFKDKWYLSWQKNGWKTSSKKPVENRGLWEKLLSLTEGQQTEFFLVKGHLDTAKSDERLKSEYERFIKHNGSSFTYDDFLKIVKMNIRADELANEFINEQREMRKDIPDNSTSPARSAVIFDLDGTLWDSSDQVAAGWNKALDENYPEIRFRFDAAAMQKCMGYTMTEIADMWFPEKDKSERAEILSVMCEYENAHLLGHPGRLFDRERSTLKELRKDHDLYIASNCQSGYIEAFLIGTELLGTFSGQICFGDTGLSKPENLKKLLSEKHLNRAVMVGDTFKDQEAAQFAGIPFIHAAYGFGTAEDPEGVAEKFSDLPQIVEKVLGSGQ